MNFKYFFTFFGKFIGTPIAAFIAGWVSVFLAAIVCAIEMAIAGTFPLDKGLYYMGLYHACIGIIEGAITAIVHSISFKCKT